MINAVAETMSQKTISQYKIIEEKYAILERYLELFFKKHNLMSKEDIDLILMALSDEPIYEVSDKEEVSEGNSN